jgi:putative acetyltransferase
MPNQSDWTLRAIEPTDFEDWWAIRNCPRVMRNTLSLPMMSRAEAEQKLANPPEGFRSIVAEIDGKMVGQVGLSVGRGRLRHSASLGMMVHDDYTGRGIGSALLAAAIDLAENWLGLTRLELEVYVDNEVAIHLYEKHGFMIEGTKRRYALREGEYVDAHLMARIKPE